MSENLVNLNVNPCKMCMPMGTTMALMGIKNSMSILHGSQGCATYIRRHMATHFNEPIDIASSSLTEEGTVFGGEKNLLKGLSNLIELYHPDVIGVCTTCLAETIGEDTKSIIKKYYEENPDCKAKIITVSSAGYGGTQYEGFFNSLRALVEQVEPNTKTNNKINIITPMISPADTRWLKAFLTSLGIDFILLPDISDNLDGVSVATYNRLKSGGTSLEDISEMAGAKLTIEFSEFVTDKSSPAEYLKESSGVPLIRMSLPTGIKSMDKFISTLKSLGINIPNEISQERGRYLDAMVDAHKYCAKSRVAIFGEPDFVKSMVNLCCENGALPLVVATGSDCPKLDSSIRQEIECTISTRFIDNIAILNDCDFDTIEEYCKKLDINVMIGSSDARRISHKLGIDLIRCAFPIHDRVGGQRVRTIGFDGSLNILDQIANSMLNKTETTFRTEIYNKFYPKKKLIQTAEEEVSLNMDITNEKNIEDIIKEKTETHPCYNCGAGQNARIHLPVAPKCNIHCNYCVRKYDCPNESRPGVTTAVLSPEEALKKYMIVKEKMPTLTVVGIAGPGDALANFEKTKKTLQLIKDYDPNVTFCLSTNGLMLPMYAQELIDLGVTHVTVTMNAIDTKIGAKIYNHVDYMGTRFTGEAGASILLANQLTGLKMLTSKGIICKVNCVTLKGINDEHIFEVTKKAKELGVYITNIMPHIAVVGSVFENLDRMTNKELNKLREKCEVNIQQMKHCRQCRADAIGTLDNDVSIEYRSCSSCSSTNKDEKSSIVRVAVATKSGFIVDQHFGQAQEFSIYESNGITCKFIENRRVNQYCLGVEECETSNESRIDTIIDTIKDCKIILSLRVGSSPEKKLNEKGIIVVSTYDKIDVAVTKAVLNNTVLV